MTMHVGSPQEGAEFAGNSGLLAQEQRRQEALKTVARLRKEASAEIERLLAFMDETDGYTMTECEPSLGRCEPDAYHYHGFDQDERLGDRDDLEMPDDDEPSLCGLTVGTTHVGGILELDGEQDQDDEPSIGSLSSGGGSQTQWGLICEGGTDAEDEHDGSEPENEGGEGVHEDDEPSLGWTADGCYGASHDRELENHTRPARRRLKAAGVTAGQSLGYDRHFIGNVTDDQKAMLRRRLPCDSGVTIRSS